MADIASLPSDVILRRIAIFFQEGETGIHVGQPQHADQCADLGARRLMGARHFNIDPGPTKIEDRQPPKKKVTGALIEQADQALYLAKAHGRYRYKIVGVPDALYSQIALA